MREQLVDFEMAKLAEEKGFKEQTYSSYWVKTLDGDVIHNSERRNCIEHDRCEVYLMQPTFGDLQDWLWEKHKIWIEINLDMLIKDNSPVFNIKVKKSDMDQGSIILYVLFGSMYKCPTSALEKGVNEALKLIKVK